VKPLEVVTEAPPEELYPLDEALADALATPLVHVGTGEWFGLFKVNSCVYRNDRVFVVNLYCGPKEMSSFGLVVLSPTRGRVYLYAEATAPISTLVRADYFTFKGETEIAQADDELPALELGFTYAQLRVWDEQRYRHYLPGCFGGEDHHRPQGGCLAALADHAKAWAARNTPFLDAPPPAWYRIVRDLRTRARTEGRPPRR